MTTRELARHCGVSQGYVVEVKNDVVIGTNHRALPTTESPKRKISRSAAAARAALLADPSRTDKEIAAEVGCATGTVRRQRHDMGLPVANRRSEGRRAADEYLEANPEATNEEVVECRSLPLWLRLQRGGAGVLDASQSFGEVAPSTMQVPGNDRSIRSPQNVPQGEPAGREGAHRTGHGTGITPVPWCPLGAIWARNALIVSAHVRGMSRRSVRVGVS